MLYNEKKKEFSISDEFKEASSQFIDNMEPYLQNSSVGFNLPKYKP